MNPIRIAVALGAAALLLGGLAAPAFADETTSTTIDSGNITDGGSAVTATAGVTSGDRTATLLGDIAFSSVDASHSDVIANAESTTIEANDLSATYAGWNVTIVASALDGSGGVALTRSGVIAADNLSVASYGALSSNAGTTATGVTTGSKTGLTTGTPSSIGTPVILLSAAAPSGVGDYTQAFDLGLVVPADSPAGDYSGTLTVTIAPPV